MIERWIREAVKSAGEVDKMTDLYTIKMTDFNHVTRIRECDVEEIQVVGRLMSQIVKSVGEIYGGMLVCML